MSRKMIDHLRIDLTCLSPATFQYHGLQKENMHFKLSKQRIIRTHHVYVDKQADLWIKYSMRSMAWLNHRMIDSMTRNCSY